MSEKKTKETSFSVSVREAAAMKPTDDNPIKAIVLTGDDVEQLRQLEYYFHRIYRDHVFSNYSKAEDVDRLGNEEEG